MKKTQAWGISIKIGWEIVMKTGTPSGNAGTDTPAPGEGSDTLPPWKAGGLAKACFSKNTRRVYGPALKLFDKSGCPETDAGVADYLERLYAQGKAAACAQMAVNALRWRARRPG